MYISGLIPYLSALDFYKHPVWNIEFDELDFFFLSLNSIFASYTGSKNQIHNRQKIKFIKLDFSNMTFRKSSADR